MRIIKKISLLPLIIILFQLFVSYSYACMCGATSVCEAYSNADAIILARVESYKSVDVPEEVIIQDSKTNEFIRGQEVILQISKVYKGKNFKQITLTQPLSSCDWEFSEKNLKKEYLFYLYHNKKYNQFRIMSCGRSGEKE